MARFNVNSRQFVLVSVPPGPQRYSYTVFPVWVVGGKTCVVGMSFGMAPKPQALLVLLPACLARVTSNDLKDTIVITDRPERCQRSQDYVSSAPRHRNFALLESLKTFSSFSHISLREQEVHVPEGEPICEKENPLQYKVHQEARQLEILVEVDVYTSWQNDRFFDIGVMSYYRSPPHGLHEALLKNAPWVADAPAEPRLL